MPVPALTQSVGKFLSAVRPLLNEDEFERTKHSASEFVKENGVGEKLQKLLVERFKNTENWVNI